MHKSLSKRKPKSIQDHLYFNSLKDQFTSKDAFLRFNQIKKHKTEMITHAIMKPLKVHKDMFEGMISKRNIFEARKGLAAVFQPLLGSVFLYGGIGQKPFQIIENFCEDNIEFTKLGEKKLSGHARHLSMQTQQNKTALKKVQDMPEPEESISATIQLC